MSRTNWTPEIDSDLIEAVDKALAAGFHKTRGPRRTDKLYVGFWTAVAIIMATAPDSPTPAACAKRYSIAVTLAAERTADKGEFTNEIVAELAALEDVFEFYDVEPVLHLAHALDEMRGRLDALCKEWGV